MPSLPTELFDYHLPDHLIAQTPAGRRDESRLLVVDRQSRSIAHRRFRDLPDYLGTTDTLIRNDAAVLPARLHAVRPTGGAVECFLLRPDQTKHATERWWCLLRPGKRLPAGSTFARPEEFVATVVDKHDDGVALVEFTSTRDESVTELANRLGRMPLPPYISRDKDEAPNRDDHERYQTVYANRQRQVAVAAPTAGLHFTPELLTQLEAQHVASATVTLHVGLGTFRPIVAEDVTDHEIHREIYEIPEATQRIIRRTDQRRVAVGTTSVRSIEDYLSRPIDEVTGPFLGEAGIFIHPPAAFRGVDALITNFHQPRSTLLCLVSAFLHPGGTEGIAWLHEIYREAIAREYRFFSYGDAMLIL